MVEVGIWETIKTLSQYVILPIMGSFAFFVRKYVKRIEHNENKITALSIRLSVVESKIDDIREDLKDIKRGVEKLVERK